MNNSRLWSSIKTIDLLFTSKFNYNLLKELQIKMPKLNTIEFYNSGDLDKLRDFSEEKEICLSSITTVCSYNWSDKNAQDWLITVLPNLKHLILTGGDSFTVEDKLIPILNNKIQQLDIDIYSIKSDFEKLIKPCYVYFSNVERINFQLISHFSIFDVEQANIIMEVLKNFKNLNTLIIYSLQENIYSWELGVPKSSGGGILFSYKRLKGTFFFYGVIEKTKLYFSILFHPYPTSTIIIKISTRTNFV